MTDENDRSRQKRGSSSRATRGSEPKSSAKKASKPKASKTPAKKASATTKKKAPASKAKPKTAAAQAPAAERTAPSSRRGAAPREIAATRRSTPEEREARRAARVAERERLDEEASGGGTAGDGKGGSMPAVDDEDIRLRLDAGAEDIEGGPKEEDPEAAKKVGVPLLVVGAIVITYLQGLALGAAAYLPLAGLVTEDVEDEFIAFPGRITSEAWTGGGGGGGGGGDGGEALAAFLVLALGLAAIAFLATATQLIRLEWRGVAMILQGAAFVPSMMFVLSQDELPAGIIFVPAVSCLAALALLATPRATNAFQRKKAPRREKGQFDILKLGESAGS